MNFFEQQEQARKNTRRLVWLFLLAVIAIVVAVYFITAGALVFFGEDHGRTVVGDPWQWWQPRLLVVVTASVLVIITFGSLTKTVQLRGGGAMLTESMGGRPITHDLGDALEQRLLNTVEEMAIASGTPVPPVYVLDHEKGINAFAAGYSTNDAVIGVARGALERLTRPQLQGVIAHEFSHVINGDMRLNLRLIGLLHGILLISLIGQWLVQVGLDFDDTFTGGRRRRGVSLPLLGFGSALALVGLLGSFFGGFIKSAVNRQREYLADAAAVQFTRNPAGIGGALKAIGGFDSHARVRHPMAPQLSHMFFARSEGWSLSALTATHPPLPRRILRIDPGWDGVFPQVRRQEPTAAETMAVASGLAVIADVAARVSIAEHAANKAKTREARQAVDSIGRPTTEHIERAAALMDRLPAALRAAAGEPFGARAVVYAMLLAQDATIRERQWAGLEAGADRAVVEKTRAIEVDMRSLDEELRLPLIDLALPSLRQLTVSQFEPFEKNVEAMIRADRQMDVFEWVLAGVLKRHLLPGFREVRRPQVRLYSLRRVGHECAVLLSALARAGHKDDEASAARAVERGKKHLSDAGVPDAGRLLPPDAAGLPQLDAALTTLATIAPRLKRPVIQAAAAVVLADEKVTAREAELLRAVADRLDCPMPPILTS